MQFANTGHFKGVLIMKYIFRVLLLLSVLPTALFAARLKDVAQIEGMRGNQLYGYGLVTGLNGTGDGIQAQFTIRSIANMLEGFGVRIDPKLTQVKNTAAVLVTATLPAFARPGTNIDVSVASIGDSKSLQGGTLIFTPLRGADGNTYAVAQGALSVGGFAVASGGDSAQQNHPTNAVIANGASVERSIPFDLFQSKRIRVVLREADFTTVTRVVGVINGYLGRPFATAIDGASIEVPIAAEFVKDPIGLVSSIENLQVDVDTVARVVVNERTGTVIMGDNVRVSKVALAHGNLNITIRAETQVSQPNALSEGGQTAVVQNTDVNVGEETKKLNVVGGEVTLGDLVQGLNALGVTPRDLISIFSALKKSGALHAELVVM